MPLVIKIKTETEIEISYKKKPNKNKQAVRIAILDETGREITMDNITVGNKRTLTAKPVNGKDQDRPVDTSGPLVWEAAPTGLVSLFPSDTGFTCDVSGVAAGTVSITVKGDADLGPGVTEILGTATLSVSLDLATKINIEVGPEVPGV